jgi:hypothetical protein
MCNQAPNWKIAVDSRNEDTGKLYNYGVYVSRHLSLDLYRKAFIQKMS